MRDLFFQKITYKEISTLIQAIYASVILSNQPNDFVKKKMEFLPGSLKNM